jgi:hypothetical protein
VRGVNGVVTRERLLLIGIVTLATAECLFWIFGALVGWSVCCWLTPMWLAIAMTVGAVVNTLGLIAFATRRRVWGARALEAAQVGNILFSIVASLAVSPAWLVFDAVPALATLSLLVVLLRARDTATGC